MWRLRRCHRFQAGGLVDENEWSVDLKSADRVLTVTADIPAEVIIAAVEEAGLKAAFLEG